jgi:hypothetical protein
MRKNKENSFGSLEIKKRIQKEENKIIESKNM